MKKQGNKAGADKGCPLLYLQVKATSLVTKLFSFSNSLFVHYFFAFL